MDPDLELLLVFLFQLRADGQPETEVFPGLVGCDNADYEVILGVGDRSGQLSELSEDLPVLPSAWIEDIGIDPMRQVPELPILAGGDPERVENDPLCPLGVGQDAVVAVQAGLEDG